VRRTTCMPVVLVLGMVAGMSAVPAQEKPRAPRPAELQIGEFAPLSPPILSREKWRARAPLPGMREQNIKGIVLHHTAVRRNLKISLEEKMRALQAFSQRPAKVSPTHGKPAWPDVPYHFYVDAGGRIAEGRDVHFAGDTNTNYSTSGYIQVVVEGDFEKEVPGPAQLDALRDLLVWLALSWNVPTEKITVHKNHAATSCPGRNFMAALPNLLAQVAEYRKKVVNEVCSQDSHSAQLRQDCIDYGRRPARRAGLSDRGAASRAAD
jgi:N-acetylmuramoyl-L-alanine amidase